MTNEEFKKYRIKKMGKGKISLKIPRTNKENCNRNHLDIYADKIPERIVSQMKVLRPIMKRLKSPKHSKIVNAVHMEKNKSFKRQLMLCRSWSR